MSDMVKAVLIIGASWMLLPILALFPHQAKSDIHVVSKKMIIGAKTFDQNHLSKADIEILENPVTEKVSFLLKISPRQSERKSTWCDRKHTVFINNREIKSPAVCAFNKVLYVISYNDIASTMSNFGVIVKSESFGTILFQENDFIEMFVDNIIPLSERDSIKRKLTISK